MSHLWQAFLVVLFLAQPFGTARLSFIFAPGWHLFYLLSLLICLTNSLSHFYLAAPYRQFGHLQHHKVSWHLSRF